MNWFNKINSNAFKDWIISCGSGNAISQGKRLDPFGSSMRKFNNAHSWMHQLNENSILVLQTSRAIDQAKIDLKSSQLIDSSTNLLSNLGRQTYSDWVLYSIPPSNADYEIHRCFLLCRNALQLRTILYKEFFLFWKELRDQYSFNHLISSPELLYFFSYFNKDYNSFNPYNVMKGLNMNDTDFSITIDWDIIKAHYNDSSLNHSVDKLKKTINGYVERQGRTNFCTALELLLNPQDSISIIDILPLSDSLKELLTLIVSENLNVSNMQFNKIYFGCPGTGKSYKMGEDTEGYKSLETTFHPEYDYAAFVGSYKPIMKAEKIHYAFTPQVFTNAYVEAYNNPDKNIVLKIEEINRGNCAMIFGDIFQLLDRHPNGESKYEVTPDADLAAYLEKNLKHKVTGEKLFTGKLKLPSNLSIYATMNTSDQSLFPMDSAFKRRWEWEYVPIDLESANTMSFVVNKKSYNWGAFLKIVNEKIADITETEDKQLGTYFISNETEISSEQFKNKVMFYLWFDVFKNYDKNSKDYIFKNKEGKYITFNDLFKEKDSDVLLESIIENLGIPKNS